MVITNLMDNNKRNDYFKSEHGLSFLIEFDNMKLVFDTGQSGDFLTNASLLDKDLSDIDALVLSHNHYDHTGGVLSLAQKIDSLKIYTGKNFFSEKGKIVEGKFFYIGSPFKEEDLHKYHCKFSVIEHSTFISENIELIPSVISKKDTNFVIKEGDDYRPDYFTEEIIILLHTSNGIALITGCSHNGIFNIIDNVKEKYPNKEIQLILGGFHLSKLDDDILKVKNKELLDYGILYIGISHCTGTRILDFSDHKSLFPFVSGSYFELKS